MGIFSREFRDLSTALEKGEPLPVPSDIDTLKGDRVMLLVTDKEERLSGDRGGRTAGNPLSAAKQREAGSPAVHTPPRGQLPCLFCYLCSVLFIKRE